MSVYAAGGSSYPLNLEASRSRERQSALDRARQRVATRATRRVAATSHRAAHRLGQQLGPVWRIVDWPDVAAAAGDDHPGFLAIGPSGVYAVSVVDQGRQRVMIAGEVIQIKSRRPPHVARARRFAKRVRRALTDAVGVKVPVVPVLTFVGGGPIGAHGLPTGCLAVSHRELHRVLLGAGDRITADTARKLADVARHPDTWASFA
jgi:hypothetical protein